MKIEKAVLEYLSDRAFKYFPNPPHREEFFIGGCPVISAFAEVLEGDDEGDFRRGRETDAGHLVSVGLDIDGHSLSADDVSIEKPFKIFQIGLDVNSPLGALKLSERALPLGLLEVHDCDRAEIVLAEDRSGVICR